MNKRNIGRAYEDKAAEYLEGIGYEILERNFYTHFGEIDIVAKDGKTIVFVEVKYRKSVSEGMPEEAVNAGKQKRIYNSARYYLYKKQIGEDTECRFDVVAILKNEIRLYKNAF